MFDWIVNTPLKYTDLTEFYLIIHFGLWFLSPPKKQEMYYFPKLLKGNAPRKIDEDVPGIYSSEHL